VDRDFLLRDRLFETGEFVLISLLQARFLMGFLIPDRGAVGGGIFVFIVWTW
jgi:hypothetical protein